MISVKAFTSSITINVPDEDVPTILLPCEDITIAVEGEDVVQLVIPTCCNNLENISINNITPVVALNNTDRFFIWRSGWFYVTWQTILSLVTFFHNALTGRDAIDCHPIAAITGLQGALNTKLENITGQSHNDLLNRNADNSHPSEAISHGTGTVADALDDLSEDIIATADITSVVGSYTFSELNEAGNLMLEVYRTTGSGANNTFPIRITINNEESDGYYWGGSTNGNNQAFMRLTGMNVETFGICMIRNINSRWNFFTMSHGRSTTTATAGAQIYGYLVKATGNITSVKVAVASGEGSITIGSKLILRRK
jgi:hypothetical protein